MLKPTIWITVAFSKVFKSVYILLLLFKIVLASLVPWHIYKF